MLVLLPEVVMPRPVEVSAVSTDAVELERLATRLGPMRLLRLVQTAEANKQPRVATAALRGLGLLASGHPDLAAAAVLPLAELIGQTHDPKLLALAADALVRLCERLQDGSTCAEADDRGCGEDLSPLPRYLLQLAGDPALPAAVRGQLVLAVRALPVPIWLPEGPRLLELARQPGAPPVREAALAALGALAQQQLDRALYALALPPTDGDLASAALAEICLPLPRKPPRPGAAAAPAVFPLAPPLADQVRALAAPTQPLPQRQRLMDCLRLLGTPQDKALLQAITVSGRKPRR
jgi:hypothetical protein